MNRHLGAFYPITIIAAFGNTMRNPIFFLLMAPFIIGMTPANELSLSRMRPFSIDDALDIESLGRVTFDPTGQIVLFEIVPSPKSLDDFSSAPEFKKRLYYTKAPFVDTPKLLPNLGEVQGVWLAERNEFSPDGKSVIIYRLKDRHVNLGVYDLQKKRVTWYLEPQHYRRHGPAHQVLWISNHEFVFASVPPDQLPQGITEKSDAANIVVREWEKAWRGKESTAHVETSKPVGESENAARAELFKSGNLVLGDVSTGRFTLIAGGLYENLTPSPNGRYLAATRVAGELLVDPTQPVTSSARPYRSQPVFFDIKNGFKVTTLCGSCDAHEERIQWSGDSSKVLFFTRGFDVHWDMGSFVQFQVPSGVPAKFNHDGLDLAPVSSRGMMASPDRPALVSGKLAVFAKPVLGKKAGNDHSYVAHITGTRTNQTQFLSLGRSDWYLIGTDGTRKNLTAPFLDVSERLLGHLDGAVVIHADGHVWRVNNDGSRAKLSALSGRSNAEAYAVQGGVSFSKPEQYVLLRGKVKNSRFFQLLDWRKNVSFEFTSPSDTASVEAVSFVGRAAIFSEQKNNTTRLLAVVFGQKSRRRPKLIFKLNEHLQGVASMEERVLTYKYRKGNENRELTSCMMLPPNWSPRRRYPTIVYIYPNSAGICRPISSFGFARLNHLAASGYIVLYVSNPIDLLRSADGRVPFENLNSLVSAAIDAAVNEGFVDSDSLGLMGESYGGTAALWLLTETDRFNAAVSVNGVSNFTSFYGAESLMSRVLGPPATLGEGLFFESPASYFHLSGIKPWEDPQRYVQASPLFSADEITTPLLLLNTDLDYHDSSQFRAMYNALSRLRRDATYVEYWGEDHVLYSPANIRDRMERTKLWFDTYLKKDES